MKLNGTVWKADPTRKQGLKPTSNGGKVLHLAFSTGTQVAERDAEGRVVMGDNGQPKLKWVNTYYSLAFFNGLAEHVNGLLERAVAAGNKGMNLEISGENTQSIVQGKNGPRIGNDFRVIAARVPGEADWATTKGGALIRRTIA